MYSMEAIQIINVLENFAPLETQEDWDCSGFIVDANEEVNKVLLCISVTENIINQAVEKNCDMIISHHPLFSVPLNFNKGISIYCAHTNLDKAEGGTTDTLIELFYGNNLSPHPNPHPSRGEGTIQKSGDFLRLVELNNEMPLEDFINLLKSKLNLSNIRIVNNLNKKFVKTIAFCAGSGMDLISEAKDADVFVTGDVKYHQALESNVIIADVGHFESEFPVLNKIKSLLEGLNFEVVIADEKSPFITY